MDWILTCALSLVASAALMTYGFVCWLYDGDVPHPIVVLDDLKALRASFGLLRMGVDALTTLFAETERHRQ